MNILEALRATTESIKTWVENKFLNKNNIDAVLNTTSENPIQNKAVNAEIENIKMLIENIDVAEQISDAINAIDYPVDSINNKTGSVILDADDFGIYVQSQEPINAVVGDIWIDTANNPSYTNIKIPNVLPNPNSLTFAGAVTGIYDGSNAVKITIPNIPSNKSDIGLENVDNVKQYSTSNPPPYPVTSVNGKTGDITLSVLPSVTSADNGKVLMVVNGVWSVVDINLSIDSNGIISI